MAPVRGVQGNRRHPFFRDEGSEPGGGGLRKGLRAEARPPSNVQGRPRPQGAGPLWAGVTAAKQLCPARPQTPGWRPGAKVGLWSSPSTFCPH